MEALDLKTATATCSRIVPDGGDEGSTRWLCGASATWQDANGEPRCEEHADGNSRRLGLSEGEEA